MKKIKKILILTIIIILAIMAFEFFDVNDIILKQIYPIKYSEYVEKYAKEYDLDPLLVYSIIKAESNFKPDVTSESSAIGLMQIMQDTAEEIAKETGIDVQTKLKLYDPEINIQIGTKYFSKLLKEYDGNTTIAIIAYNAGPGNVDKWIEERYNKKRWDQYRKYTI